MLGLALVCPLRVSVYVCVCVCVRVCVCVSFPTTTKTRFSELEMGLDFGEGEALASANTEVQRLREELRRSKEVLHLARTEAADAAARASQLALELKRQGLLTPSTKQRVAGTRQGMAHDAHVAPHNNGLASIGGRLTDNDDVALSLLRDASNAGGGLDDDDDDLDTLLNATLDPVNRLAMAPPGFNDDLREVGTSTDFRGVDAECQTRVTGKFVEELQAKVAALEHDGTVTGALAKWSKAKLAEEYQKLRRIAWDIRNENARLVTSTKELKVRRVAVSSPCADRDVGAHLRAMAAS